MANNGEKGKEMAEALLDFVNGASSNDKNTFVEHIVRGHRALQQDAFMLMLDTVKAWANLSKAEIYDARNENAVLTSAVIVKSLEDRA